MSKLSKLIKNPRLFLIDGYKNFKFKFLKIPKTLNKFINLLNSEKFNKILIYCFTSFTFITFSYFYLIGRSKYVVSSSVVVRKTSDNNTPGLSFTSLVGGGNQQSLEDARFLEVYVQSPQVLEELEKGFNFSKAFQKEGLDIFSGIKPDSKRESKYDFFVKQIKINLNPNSGVIELKTYAFNPEDAFKINQFLLKQSENFVNSLNQEIFKRQLDFGDEQIKKTKEKLDDEVKKLESFQSNYKMLNIEYESKSTLNMIGGLESKLVDLQIKLSDAERIFLDQNSPEITYLTDQVNILKKQIENERSKLVSDEGKALNKRLAEINEIESNISFLKEIYKTTLATSERNRIDSSQQQRFLAILSKPYKPEEEWNYWRHKGFLTYLSLITITFSLTKFIFGIAENHKD